METSYKFGTLSMLGRCCNAYPLILFFIFVVNAGEFFVSDSNGTSASDCGSLSTNPCKSLQLAINKITFEMSTVTINIFPGIYTGKGNTNITVPNYSNITIQNYEPQQEVLYSCGNDRYTSFIPWEYDKKQQFLIIKGLTIRECEIGISFYGKQGTDSLIVQNVSITDNCIGIKMGKGSLVVENSYFGARLDKYNCYSIQTSGDGSDSGNLTFKSSIFEDTYTAYSISAFTYNNVIMDSVQFINAGKVSFDSYHVNSGSIKNCIFDNSNVNVSIAPPGYYMDFLLKLSNYGYWELSNCSFDASTSSNVTSAISIRYNNTVIISDSHIRAYAETGIDCYSSELSVKDSTISNSKTGIYAALSDEVPYLIENVNFTNCVSSSIHFSYPSDYNYGSIFHINIKNINVHNSGRVYVYAPTLGSISNSSFSNILGQERAILIKGDVSEWYFENIEVFDTVFPGGINIHNDDVKASFKNCKFTNSEGDNGGAIFFEGSELNIENCDFEQNSANYGGAIYMEDGNCNVKSSSFTSNKATYGSAIYCSSSNIETDDVTLSNGDDIYCYNVMYYVYISLIVFAVVIFVVILLMVGLFVFYKKKKSKKSKESLMLLD